MTKTLVIGASENRERYSYLAVTRLQKYGHEVKAIGLKNGKIGEVRIETGMPQWEGIHTVILYINPLRQPQYYQYILDLKPARVIFNPGTENPDFEEMLEKNGIEALEACTLVLLSIGTYDRSVEA
jgi:uncharacterized protein